MLTTTEQPQHEEESFYLHVFQLNEGKMTNRNEFITTFLYQNRFRNDKSIYIKRNTKPCNINLNCEKCLTGLCPDFVSIFSI